MALLGSGASNGGSVTAVDLTAKFDVPAELVAATDKAVIRKLSVGAGAKDKDEGYTTIDIAGEPDVVWDITQTPWPFESDYFRGVKAHHILEHIPRDTYVFHWEPKRDVLDYSTGGDQWNAPTGTMSPVKVAAGSRSYIENRKGLVDVMNEMWRVLEPEGRCWIEVPLFPTEDAVADPTHGSFLVSQTFDYFVKGGIFEEQRMLYGIKPWAMQRREKLNYGRILYVLLRKVAE